MKVLVTGGAGFIGSHTVDKLVEKGYKIRILDNLEPQVHKKAPNYLNNKVEMMKGSIANKGTWKKALEGVDGVMHLAAMVGVGQSMYQPVRYLDANTIGTAKFYEVLVENKQLARNIKSIVSASSKSIYGEGSYQCKAHGTVYPGLRKKERLEKHDWEAYCPECDTHVKPVPVKESKPAQNPNVYALSKYTTEILSLTYGHVLGIPTTAFRYFNVYGPRQSLNNPYTGVCAIFMSRVKNSNQPVVYEDGNQLRDFIYVEDIASANAIALEKARETDVYNLGSGTPNSILEVAQTIIKIYGSSVQPRVTNEFREGDTRHDYSDISKARKAFSWAPRWTLRKGLEELIEWSESQEAEDKFEQAEAERKRMLGG